MVDILERSSGSPTQDYLRRLSRVLPGRGRARRDLLRELADGLEDSAEGFVAEGHSRESAEREAVAQFGPIATVAHECGRELLAAATRRLAVVFGIVMPLAMAAWDAIWMNLPTPAAARAYVSAPDWYPLVSRGVDITQVVAASIAIVAAIVLTRGHLTQRRPEVVTVLLCIWVLVSMAATTGGGAILSSASAGWYTQESETILIGLVGVVTALVKYVVCFVAVRQLHCVLRLRRLRA